MALRYAMKILGGRVGEDISRIFGNASPPTNSTVVLLTVNGVPWKF